MELGDYTSLFEVFAIFNLAYFGSKHFDNVLDQKVYSAKEELNRLINHIDKQIYLQRKAVQDLGSIVLKSGENDEEKEKKLGQEILSDLAEVRQSYQKKKSVAEEKIDTLITIKGFPKICLFSSFFCLSILVCAGLVGSNLNIQSIYLSIFSVSLIHFALTGAIFINDTFDKFNKINAMSSLHVILLYAFLLGISVLFVTYCTSYNQYFFSNYNHYLIDNLGSLLIAITIVIPILHFILYFVRFFYAHAKSIKIANKLKKEFDPQIDDISKKIDDRSNALDILRKWLND